MNSLNSYDNLLVLLQNETYMNVVTTYSVDYVEGFYFDLQTLKSCFYDVFGEIYNVFGIYFDSLLDFYISCFNFVYVILKNQSTFYPSLGKQSDLQMNFLNTLCDYISTLISSEEINVY